MKFTTQTIPIIKLDANTGQIADVPQNPRKISEEEMERLKKSITDDPEFLTLWKPTVFPMGDRFVVLSGNQKLKACQTLKIRSLTCDVLDEATLEENLRQTAQVAVEHGLPAACRYLQQQIAEERLNVFLPYRSPPPPRELADWEKPIPPEERCTPEDIAETRKALGFCKKPRSFY